MLHGLSLFSGIGGIDLGLSPWVRTVAYCELDEHAQWVLCTQMERGQLDYADIYHDVRKLRAADLSSQIDAITGGFPCQDLSVAGKRAGLDGKRSGLYHEVLRLTAECEPTLVFLENVPGIKGYLHRIAGDFRQLGLGGFRACTLSAASVGSPQKRDRVFMLAANVDRLKLWLEPGRSSGPNGRETLQPPPPPEKGVAADHHHQGQLQSGGPEREEWRRTIHGALPAWRDEADKAVSLLVHGLPARLADQRLLGNSCIPAQARTAFAHLMGWSTTEVA